MSALVFLAVVLGLTLLIHLYFWQRLVRDTTGSRRWRRLGGAAILSAALVMLTTLLAEPVVARPSGWLTAPGYLWVGIMFYLLLALLALELPVLAALVIGRIRGRSRPRRQSRPPPAQPSPESPTESESPPAAVSPPEPDSPPDPGRRRLLRRGAAIVAGAATAGLTGYGVVRAYAPPTVKRLQVPLARLDRRADGLRVAVVADVHVGPLYGNRQVERLVDMVNDLRPDVVTVVGDLASSEVGAVRAATAALSGLRSRYGVYFVTGNHEYYTGHEEWIEVAGELGFQVLRNQRVEIAHGGGAIDLAGVNDREGSRYDDPPDYAAALGDRDESRPVVLLAHQPVQVRQAAAYRVDLQLSGHTHGGQLAPFDRLVRLDQPAVSGLAEVDGTRVYVTNGAGFWGPPMRVGAAPDISLIELRAGRG